MRRIFIAVNPPRGVKNRLAKTREKWLGLPVRWTKPEHLHITLVFIGYASEEEVNKIIDAAREVAKARNPFAVTLTRVDAGPPDAPKRMIWAHGERGEELAALKDDAEKKLSRFQKRSARRSQEFRPHITLARVIPNNRRALDAFIGEEMKVTFRVQSIEVMESKLKKTGAEYAVLESVELGPH